MQPPKHRVTYVQRQSKHCARQAQSTPLDPANAWEFAFFRGHAAFAAAQSQSTSTAPSAETKDPRHTASSSPNTCTHTTCTCALEAKRQLCTDAQAVLNLTQKVTGAGLQPDTLYTHGTQVAQPQEHKADVQIACSEADMLPNRNFLQNCVQDMPGGACPADTRPCWHPILQSSVLQVLPRDGARAPFLHGLN